MAACIFSSLDHSEDIANIEEMVQRALKGGTYAFIVGYTFGGEDNPRRIHWAARRERSEALIMIGSVKIDPSRFNIAGDEPVPIGQPVQVSEMDVYFTDES